MSAKFKIKADSIITRSRAGKVAEEALEGGHSKVDMSEVEFVSRSVADELIHYREEYGLEFICLQDDVEAMLEVVSGDEGLNQAKV